jgi:predicted TIM-barrel fold metal-dependent hydrolase
VVIDAHLHLWDVARHRYEWLQRPENSAIRRTFGFADFAARAAAAAVALDLLAGRPKCAAIRTLIHDQPDPDWLLRAAAANPLVYAKVSGLYPPRAEWTAADIRPYVEFALELFGPGRLMFGSDWPVAELGGGYQRVWAAISSVLGELPPAGRDAVLGGTARVFYQLGEAAQVPRLLLLVPPAPHPGPVSGPSSVLRNVVTV